MENELTLFYMIRTGKIKAFCSGRQSMAFYGDEEQDFKGIIDCITIPHDDFILNNRDYYKVINGELIFER